MAVAGERSSSAQRAYMRRRGKGLIIDSDGMFSRGELLLLASGEKGTRCGSDMGVRANSSSDQRCRLRNERTVNADAAVIGQRPEVAIRV